MTATGTIKNKQDTTFSGQGSDHTFAATPNSQGGFTVVITLTSGGFLSGTMTK